MHVIQSRNVNEAYRLGMQLISAQGIRQPSRAGEVLAVDRPVTTIYERPMERVLFDPKRDANPIFHLMESIWMLAGMRDARWLDQFVGDFSKRFAEDNGEAHGAYGHRWRKHFLRDGVTTAPVFIDQLTEAGAILLKDPTSRQAVVSMWDPAIDLGAKKRDIPCNDLIMFRGRYDHTEQLWLLDTTVLCRSNDIVWGAYGANAVHMSFMAEVVAALAGMKLGRYYQVSNNYHAYTEIFNKVYPPATSYGVYNNQGDPIATDPYRMGMAVPIPIFSDYAYEYRGDARATMAKRGEAFLAECESFMDDRAIGEGKTSIFFQDVVHPLMRAHRDYWKQGKRSEALDVVRQMKPSDWQLAAIQWMGRRILNQQHAPEVRSK